MLAKIRRVLRLISDVGLGVLTLDSYQRGPKYILYVCVFLLVIGVVQSWKGEER